MNPRRGPVSDAKAELVYRALITTIAETEDVGQAELVSAFLGCVPWEETKPGVRTFVRKLTRELVGVVS